MVDLLNDIRIIYEHIEEEESKEYYVNRLLYNLTNDKKYMFRIIEKVWPQLGSFLECKEGLVLFGAGRWGENILRLYSDAPWKYIIDNDSRRIGKRMRGIQIIGLDEYLQKEMRSKIVISSRLYNKEICEQLMEKGVENASIVNFGGIIDEMSKKQYFDLPYLSKCEKEVFVDGGCFDGETSVQFAKWSKGEYEKIYAFEPDTQNVSKVNNKFNENQIEKYEIVTKGLWSSEKILHFSANSNGTSQIADLGETEITVGKLDEMINDKVTFIKFDLEGAELDALRGAERIIRENTPKLAISIYHKPEDVWELPKLILDFNPDYKLYVRHYSLGESETVLYAI